MAGKKKDMDGGLLFEYFTKTPTDTIQVLNKSNAYLNTIRELEKSYSKIDSNKISVNNLNTKVKSLSIFSQKIKNKEELMPLLDAVKKILIKKIELSLTSKFVFDYTIPPSKLLDNLLHQLKEFEKLLNQLKLLDNQFNLSYSTSKESFIENILGKYEDYIEQIFRENPNIDILGQLSQQVQEYIRLYSEFIKSMTNNRKMTNPISKILQRLNILSDRISIKIQLLSGQGTNINGNHISNEMKRRINLLYDANRNKKSINYNSILTNLHVEYQNNPRKYNLKELSITSPL